MPQIGTADVTYTGIVGTHLASPSVPMKEHQMLMFFPNGTNVLYTSGGIPISKPQVGFPAVINKFIIEDEASTTGYVCKWDQLANTIRLYQVAAVVTGSATPAQQLVEMTTAATVASTTLRILAQGW